MCYLLPGLRTRLPASMKRMGSVIQTPASILWVALWAPTIIWPMILSLGLVLVKRPRVIEYSQCSTTLPGQCYVYCISIPNQSPSQSTTSACKLCQCHVYCMLPISNLAGKGTTHIIVTPIYGGGSAESVHSMFLFGRYTTHKPTVIRSSIRKFYPAVGGQFLLTTAVVDRSGYYWHCNTLLMRSCQ